MTNVRMVYLLEEETQLHLIQLRDHLKLLSLLASPRFRKDEHHSLPIPLQPLSDCFAGLSDEASHILDQLRWHSGKPDADSANDA
ncbi:XAC0095 family protein [Pseudoxanthomonas sp.]|uniref:XAC0095 family protein n=1 Tax=Pseudoxanthomonas sp. TaxID=1871049 RepID=UPI003F7EA301